MFKFFKKRKEQKALELAELAQLAEDKANEAAFYQAVVDQFVTRLDEWALYHPDKADLKSRWHFNLDDIGWGHADNGHARFSCRITASDQQGVYPALSEYAHGFGEEMSGAVDLAYRNWIETDLPVLIDAGADQAELCQEVSFENTASGQKTRGLLGPMQFWSAGTDGPKPCCNSCIFTQALQADESLMSRETPFLIKAVVGRNPDNTAQSDFRINGEQNEAIATALSEWAKTWDGEGFAMRKQSLLFV